MYNNIIYNLSIVHDKFKIKIYHFFKIKKKIVNTYLKYKILIAFLFFSGFGNDETLNSSFPCR